MRFSSALRRVMQVGVRRFGLMGSLLTIVLLLGGCRGAERSSVSAPSVDPVEECCGVRVERIALTAAGYMLDLRLRVVDEQKASRLFGEDLENYLIHQESGSRLIVPSPPKVGAMRQNQNAPRKDRTYFVMFANPGRLVKTGDHVNVVIGDVHIDDLSVQ